MSVVVITGGSAGAGKATALRFADAGYDIAVIARGDAGLEATRIDCERRGVRVQVISADVADAAAVMQAAHQIEEQLGEIAVWVNNAMCAVLSPFTTMSHDEFQRVTEVTYYGFVNGTRAALAVMRPRNRGVIIQVGSALAYRSIPLQSAYCGAKAAIRGFTDAVRTELMHEQSGIQLIMVQLPGMNTPQFAWARNKMGFAMQPVPPVYQPEVAAKAIYSVTLRPVRELWVGKSTLQSIVGQFLFPRFLDRLMVKKAWAGQLTSEPHFDNQPDNLFTPLQCHHHTHGRYGDGARNQALNIPSDLPGKALSCAAVVTGVVVLARWLQRKR
ncbi:short-chain alcohol dehydrogenase family protein [Trabulsiella guamensis ATCC 49490]|uniref:Short-chain alcohol dehydrogenase family protein n=1 Tax=Trabulsiella guamensis ATCC 49490 TaxID=1005994 RepID=A0A085AKU3_9ENTR|nr:SDR family oxidoreductase [Trabulsiella guamensis]KFC10838.1 short-chain alcohol dehydrogenase family protein [Trabulsiella guamensis ATCC 49490]